MRIGIDFGTTNSGVAYYDGTALYNVNVDAKDTSRNTLPSLIYFDRQLNTEIGSAAAIEYIEKETGRSVSWRSKVIGEIHMIVAGQGGSPIEYWQPVNILIDEKSVGRLFQSVKTYLRRPDFEGTYIFEHYRTVDQIISILLSKLKSLAEDKFGQKCDEVVIGRPVKLAEKDDQDAKAEEILYKAGILAGFADIRFAIEPLGATYAYHVSQTTPSNVLIFDFGGGTLDLTLAKVGGNTAPEVIASKGVLFGGDDIDKSIMKLLYKYFAADDLHSEITIDHSMIPLLESWQTMPELSKPHFRETLVHLQNRARMTKSRDAVNQLNALEDLVEKGLGYELFRDIEEVKKRLSEEESTALNFQQERISISENVRRTKLERNIRHNLKEIGDAVEDLITAAGMTLDDVDKVVRTGGTSQVPVFVKLLEDMFGQDKLSAIDPLDSVVGGLAIVAHQGTQPVPPYAYKYFSSPDNLLTLISCKGSLSYDSYIFAVGNNPYVDNDKTRIERLPIDLSALCAIRTARADLENDSEEFLEFHISIDSYIYVAYGKSSKSLPNWLKEFNRTSYEIEVRDEFDRVTQLEVYKKRYNKGIVMLGGNKANNSGDNNYAMYMIIVEPNPVD